MFIAREEVERLRDAICTRRAAAGSCPGCVELCNKLLTALNEAFPACPALMTDHEADEWCMKMGVTVVAITGEPGAWLAQLRKDPDVRVENCPTRLAAVQALRDKIGREKREPCCKARALLEEWLEVAEKNPWAVGISTAEHVRRALKEE